MNSITLLIDCILLLLLESKANLEIDSQEVIQKLLDYQESKNDRWNIGNEGIMLKLTTIIETLLLNIKNGDKIDVNKTIRILKIETSTTSDLDGDEELKETIVEMINDVMSLQGDELYDTISSLKNSIVEIYNAERLKKLMQSQLMKINKKSDNKKYKDILIELKTQLERIEENAIVDDEAIMYEIDLNDLVDEKKAKELESSVVTKHIFRTGWKGYNRMLQGGIRVPEFRSVPALTHNYKSGFHLSIFCSIVLYNKPMVRGKGIPLAVYISFEDDIIPIFEFIYQLLHITNTGKVLKEIDVPTIQMIGETAKKLQATGFAVKILKINPTEWSYMAFVNKIKKYISQGYDVQIVDVDYFEKLPTTGINANGPTGYDKKVLVRKIRNFLASIGATGGTPWQLSPKASDLKKDGLTETDFLPFIHNKQYYQGSSTLGNEMDLETFTNKIETSDNGCWLNIHIGKHKIPTVVDTKYKNYYLPFPSNGPIPFDLTLDKEIGAYDIKTPNPFY